jgi:hypothetical protein
MRKRLFFVVVAACLLMPPALGHAQEASKAPSGSATPAPSATDMAARPGVAESRYRAWVDQEHAKDAAAFQQERSRIEDKYKGYVRPKHEKKVGKTRPAGPAVKTD